MNKESLENERNSLKFSKIPIRNERNLSKMSGVIDLLVPKKKSCLFLKSFVYLSITLINHNRRYNVYNNPINKQEDPDKFEDVYLYATIRSSKTHSPYRRVTLSIALAFGTDVPATQAFNRDTSPKL